MILFLGVKVSSKDPSPSLSKYTWRYKVSVLKSTVDSDVEVPRETENAPLAIVIAPGVVVDVHVSSHRLVPEEAESYSANWNP